MPLLGGSKEFSTLVSLLASLCAYSIDPPAVRDYQEVDLAGSFLARNGNNAARILREVARRSPRYHKRLVKILSSILPGLIDIAGVRRREKLLVVFTQLWSEKQHVRFDSFSMSDGTLRALGILLALFQHPTPPFMFVEEPEATLHPGALDVMTDTILASTDRCQIAITTHSIQFLNAKGISDEHIRIVKWTQSGTAVERLGPNSRSVLADHLMGLGELIRSNALDTEPLFEARDMNQLELFDDSTVS
jgi:predicted ATPase